MNIHEEIESLLKSIEMPLKGQKDIVPSYLENRYNRLGAIENIKQHENIDEFGFAALLKVLASDDEEEVREAALSTICTLTKDDSLKKIAIIISSVDQNDRVLTTALEEANNLDLPFAKEIAKKLVSFPDPMVSEYANGILNKP